MPSILSRFRCHIGNILKVNAVVLQYSMYAVEHARFVFSRYNNNEARHFLKKN